MNTENRLQFVELAKIPLESPARLLLTLALSVFVIELSLMVAFALLPPIPEWVEVFLDALLLVTLLFPLLYFLIFRPLRTLIAQHLLAERELALLNQRLQEDIAERRRIEEALRESESQFRDMLENAPIGMAVTALDGRFLQVNQAFCDIVGYRKLELEQLGYADITFPDDLAVSVENVERLLAGGRRSFQMEGRYLHKNGRLLWVKICCSVHLGKDAVPKYFITQIEDITEYKHSNEREQLLASVFEHSIEAILITDSNNRIIEINPAFTRLTGYVLHDVLGRDPKLLSAHRQPPGFYQQMWQSLRNDGYWHGEVWDRRKDGSLFPRWLTITAVHDAQNKIINYIGSFTDISQLKGPAEGGGMERVKGIEPSS
jgi:PAS domain S-box-containing protein